MLDLRLHIQYITWRELTTHECHMAMNVYLEGDWHVDLQQITDFVSYRFNFTNGMIPVITDITIHVHDACRQRRRGGRLPQVRAGKNTVTTYHCVSLSSAFSSSMLSSDTRSSNISTVSNNLPAAALRTCSASSKQVHTGPNIIRHRLQHFVPFSIL